MFEFREQESKIHISNFKKKNASGLVPLYNLRLRNHSKITFLNENKVQENVDLLQQFKVTDGRWAIYHFP